MQQNRVNARLMIAAGLASLCMMAIFGRLGYLQLYRHSEYLTRAQRQQQRTIEITPKRGAIYDRNMHPLAMSIPVKSAYAMPGEMADQPLVARLLSGIVDLPREVLEQRLGSTHSFVWIKRKLSPEKVQAIEALNLKGVYFQAENQRFYPKRELAAHVLGFVDTDENGLGGIEYQLDSVIRGKSEKIIVMQDARSRSFDRGAEQREHGASVILTLDEKIQYIAQRELEAAIAKTHAIAGTVIVQDPNSGALLAVANWPRFNPNVTRETPAESRMNRAVTALYEPGSTFKLITLAAALNEGLTRPGEVFDCQHGKIQVAGHTIHDHKPFDLLNVSEILAKSSDVGAIKIAERLGPPKFYEYIRAFGFGEPTGVDLPGESKGLLRDVNRWSAISIGAISMGQEVGVTPLQLVTAVSAIANGGLLYKPHIVQEVRRSEQMLPAESSVGAAEPKRVIRPETAATLRRMMEGVVLDGTGVLARLDGWTAAGKTGSAQKIDPETGRYSRSQFIASFSGFAPINNPAVTILISLDSPVGLHEGGMVAAPVFKRIAEQVLPYLGVPRDVPLNARLLQASYKKREDVSETASLDDFTPADFSSPLEPTRDAPTTAKIAEAKDKPPLVTAAVVEGGDILVPDFAGKTMREVTEVCLRLGLDPVLVGSSLAVQQTPAAGAKVRHGAKITVEFAAGTPKARKAR